MLRFSSLRIFFHYSLSPYQEITVTHCSHNEASPGAIREGNTLHICGDADYSYTAILNVTDLQMEAAT
jgi:hypothetical protein